MASFADAVNALVAERDRQFVLRIATEYNLNVEELQKKYLDTAEMAIKVPRKYKKREPTSVTVVTEPKEPKAPKAPKAKAEKQKCTACTSKKEPCKFSAIKGEVFCKRHLKQSVGESETLKEPKTPKAPKAAKKAEQPVHTHDLTEGVVNDCDLCQSHGNPLVEAEGFELAAPHCGPIKQLTTAQRLAAILNAGDTDEEVEDEADEEVRVPYACPEESEEDLAEEAFEEED
jgi:hypothetical protein